jgi:hypothetical protein
VRFDLLVLGGGFGCAVRVDIRALFEAWRRTIERRGRVLLRTAGRRLLVDCEGRVSSRVSHATKSAISRGPRVSGARILGPQGADEIRADAVVLATGGFQGDPDLLATFVGSSADSMLVRSNPWSVGDGFRLGRAVGAAPAAAWAASTVTWCRAPSPAGAKTSSGRTPRPRRHTGRAARRGGRLGRGPAGPQGDAGVLGNRSAQPGCPSPATPGAPARAAVLRAGSAADHNVPVNADGRVLDRDGETVPGLFAVGADAGGLQDGRYAGGPSLGAVFGPRAADAALGAAATKVPDEGGGQGEA